MVAQKKRETKIDLILEKGIELLWSRGYAGTSVNDIAKAAGVPKGSFHFYFDSKDDFILKALDKYFYLEIKPVLQILHDKGKSPKKRLIEYYEYRIDSLKNELQCQKGCMVCNLSNEIAERNEAIRNKVNSFHTKMRDEIIEVVQEGQGIGEIGKKISAKKLVEFIEDAYNGSMISMKEIKSVYPVENVLTIVRTLIL